MRLPIKRFVEKIKFPQDDSACWEWIGSKRPDGYGQFKMKGRVLKAHRCSWEFFVGDIPEDICVLHHCDNKGCVNPKHLFLGTSKDNQIDMMKKDKSALAKLKISQVRRIKRGITKGVSQSELAKRYNVDRTTISHIARGYRWKYVSP